MEEENKPRHIAIIMDGNRRWAKERKLPVQLGHKKGAETLENIIRYANKIGVEYVTVYAFSTENWKRSKDEVDALMQLLKSYLDSYSKRANTENIRIKVIGDMSALSKDLQQSIANAIARTKNNTGTTFIVALNYGGRNEITNAVKKIALKVKNNELKIEDITENTITENLYTSEFPDPDIVVRTSGEIRSSGFLTWQSVYSEYLFLEKYWPDFSEKDLDNVIQTYQNRHRRIGK